ncbi:MAG TPA: EutN/CcmL family microcompartment protein [Kiritimatiellia bacterium]|nr:EutN/CcmL family microcompartment protein [Kiritimatiellia bacterium]HMO97773.1 EutN/CcmL family microcompartment protein [Kiritimatiellia bacterium]HMP95412.1 EutN/CcmL family microcompartment protein [Kiritimatiellia bacterium]
MITGRVIGQIYSTINHPFYDGKKLMIVEKTDPTGKAGSDYLIAVDSVGAGPGEPVLILDEGNGARQVLNDANAPVRSVIVGIIDHVST